MTRSKEYKFVEGGGAKVMDGKTEWPDYLVLVIDESQAWDMLRKLVARLEEKRREPEFKIYFPLFGELSDHTED